MKQQPVRPEFPTSGSLTRISDGAAVGSHFENRPRNSSGSASSRARVVFLLLFIGCVPLAGCKRATEKAAGASHEEGKLQQLAKALDDDMEATERQASALAGQILAAYTDFVAKARTVDSASYRLEENGVLHRPGAVAADLPAVFVSGAVEVDDRILTIVKGTESIDPALKGIVNSSELVVQAYYNDRHSYNRIYPPFDVLAQYAPGVSTPDYNFYYLADGSHNPDRKSIWIHAPYVDPAGRGWMVSCLAPVYRNEALEGVCGLDVTVEALVRDLDLEESNDLYVVVSNDGTVVAAGEKMSRVLRLPNLKRHRYVDTVRSDTLRTDDYNLRKSSSSSIREMIDDLTVKGRAETDLDLDGQKWRVRSASLTRLDWHVLEFTKRP
jgi:hypothetical protein